MKMNKAKSEMDKFDKDLLLPYFEKIHPTNWKEAFTCEVSAKDYAMYDEACIYFTGARLEVVSQTGDEMQCYCQGYYNAVGP